MPASHFDVNSMTGRPKFIVRHSTTVPSNKFEIRVGYGLYRGFK
jgi:hypothetical protein